MWKINIVCSLLADIMSGEEDFKEQLRQEELAAESEDLSTGRTRVDEDGTVSEWDPGKSAWFPKVGAIMMAE